MQGQTANWKKADSLLKNSVQTIYHDTTDNSIYVGGYCHRIGNDTIVGIGRFRNGQWYRMGNGVDWLRSFPWDPNTIPNPVRSIIKYKDTIYITGSFSHTDGKPLNGIAKWNGTEWKPIGSGLKDKYNLSGGGTKFKIFNNELYIVGAFDSIAGVAANSLAKYNGVTWQAVHNLPVYDPTGNQNLLEDLEMYNSELYVTGVMYNNTTVFSTVKWNGTSWVNPGFNAYGASTMGLFVFKNELYIIGSWSQFSNPNNIGNCIAKYNGVSWQAVGGGMFVYPFYLANVKSYAINNNYLFLGGGFNVCNYNRTIRNIVRHDGVNWCSVDTTYHPSYIIESMDFINDTLYIGGAGLGSQLSNVGLAYCKNYHHADTCSVSYVGINELENVNIIKFYPNPTTSIINITDEQNQFQNSVIEVKNYLGQVVFTSPFTPQIDISYLSAGMYFLNIKDEYTARTVKFIKE